MGVPPMGHVTKGHVAEERGGLSQPEVYSFSGGYLMRSRQSFLVTSQSTLFLLEPPRRSRVPSPPFHWDLLPA